MAGAGLIAIKRRIRSINNTKKITKAVGLVATSKLKKLRGILDLNTFYHENFIKIIQDIIKENKGENNLFIDGNKSNKKLFIAITSDTGLCGGFNGNVVSKARDYISKDKENSSLIIVGQKGRAYFRKLNVESIAEYVDIPDVPTKDEAYMIVNKVIELFKKDEIGEVYVIYTRFISAVKQEVTIKKMLPFDLENLEVKNQFIDFEPRKEKLLSEVCQPYLASELLNHMLNSKTSEESMRMSAMDGATSNADDLLDKLKLKYNRIRQSIITQEISEIVGGAEAQR